MTFSAEIASDDDSCHHLYKPRFSFTGYVREKLPYLKLRVKQSEYHSVQGHWENMNDMLRGILRRVDKLTIKEC